MNDKENKDDNDKRYLPAGMKIIDPVPIKKHIKQDIDISLVALLIGLILYMIAIFFHEIKTLELCNFDKNFNAGYYDG